MDKLKEAITNGRNKHRESLESYRMADEVRKNKEIEEFRKEVEFCKAALTEDDRIYSLISNAVARGNSSFSISGKEAMAAAINSLPGLHAEYIHFNDNQGPDLNSVVVTWDDNE